MRHPSHRLKQGGTVQGVWMEGGRGCAGAGCEDGTAGQEGQESALSEGTGIGMRVSDQIWGAGSFERSRRQLNIEGS